MRRSVPAGLVDSSFAALATFAVTIYGARTMDPETFGFFALYWAAFLMAAIVPAQMLFQPWEIAAVRVEVQARISFLRRALKSGLVVAFTSGVIASGLAWVMAGSAPLEVARTFSLSLVIAAVISPIQDFVRRMLHVAGRPGRASVVSVTQFVSVMLTLMALRSLGLPVLWVPFIALTVANLVSSAVGLQLARGSTPAVMDSPPWREVTRSGSWLLVMGLIVPFAGLVVNWLVITIAGAALLGLAEAARIVGRPVLVITNGLGLALRPMSYEAATRHDLRRARRVRRVFGAVTLIGGLLYTAVVSVPWRGNVMFDLVPMGFEIPGLVAAICLANVLVGISFPARYELIALRREGYATAIELAAQSLKSIAALAAGHIGGFVIPVGDALLGVLRLIGYPPALKKMYDSADGPRGLSETDSDPHDSP